MSTGEAPLLRDGTVAFLPHRLNRQPVVVRGLSADELWITVGLFAVLGGIVGVPLAIALRSIALAPTMVMLSVAAGVFVAGGIVRRQKRGRPDTWLYRQIQWRARLKLPTLSHGWRASHLIIRSGVWTTRRSVAGRAR